MKNSRNKNETAYIQLNTSKCIGCFQCNEVCSKGVLGKINILIHKHALIRNGETCVGCGKCVKICNAGAIIYSFGNNAGRAGSAGSEQE
jgi:NAD-dependent dihydropyrimidine dehydrogenase PreA subunit